MTKFVSLKNKLRSFPAQAWAWLRAHRRDAAPWAERETLFPLEVRAGAAVFAGLVFLSWAQAGPWRAYGMAGGEFFRRIGVPTLARSVLQHAALFLTALLVGGLGGAAVRAAWLFGGRYAPQLDRGRLPAAARAGVTAGAVLLLHAAFLTRHLFLHPALYQDAFYARGGMFRALQVFVTDGASAWPRAFLAGFAVVTLAAAGLHLFILVFHRVRNLPQPKRLALFVLGGGWAAAVLGVWGVVRFQAPRNRGPNLLLVTAASLRSDLLRTPIVPRLNDLARDGRTYSACIPPLPQTAPALMTLFTGRSPLTHGVRHAFPPSEDVRLGPEDLPGFLHDNGYATAALADAGGDFFSRLRGPFQKVRAPRLDLPGVLWQRTLRRHVHLFPYLDATAARRVFPRMRSLPELSEPARLARETRRRLERLAHKDKFFLAVHFSNLSDPCAAAGPVYRDSMEKNYSGPHKYRFVSAASSGDDEEARRARELYRAGARAFDEAVGVILDGLREERLEDNTVVAVVSLHGEQLFERGLGRGHGGTVWGGEVFSAPLILLSPRRRVAARWVDEPVRLQDAAPTLLSLLGFEAPGSMEGFPLDRREFGGPPEEFFLAYAETEWPPGDGAPPGDRLEVDLHDPRRVSLAPAREDRALIGKHRMVQLGWERLVYIPGRSGVTYQLYDLAADPAGMKNLAAEPGGEERVRDLREMLYRFLSREAGWHPQNGYWIPEAFLREETVPWQADE